LTTRKSAWAFPVDSSADARTGGSSKTEMPGWLGSLWNNTGGRAVSGVAEAWDRGSTVAQYGIQSGWRRIKNIPQTTWDTGTGTTSLEIGTAVSQIWLSDAELYNDGEYCGTEGECLMGGVVPGGKIAITLGHTVTYSDPLKPDPQLVEHEFQHVYDYENQGGVGFLGNYSKSYISWLPLTRNSDAAYSLIPTEVIAYAIDDNPSVGPRGVLSWMIWGPNEAG
jgi:hypothetical protein